MRAEPSKAYAVLSVFSAESSKETHELISF